MGKSRAIVCCVGRQPTTPTASLFPASPGYRQVTCLQGPHSEGRTETMPRSCSTCIFHDEARSALACPSENRPTLLDEFSRYILEAGKKRLAGDTAREATSEEVKELPKLICRRRAPKPVNRTMADRAISWEAVWPIVGPEDWCGEWSDE